MNELISCRLIFPLRRCSLLQPNCELIFVMFQIQNDRDRKDGKKVARQDKDLVKEKVFAAFEHHQYFAIKDLCQITGQPYVSYCI